MCGMIGILWGSAQVPRNQ